MIYAKYIGNIALIVLGIFITFSGSLSIIEGSILAGLFIVLVGAYLIKIGLGFFRKNTH